MLVDSVLPADLIQNLLNYSFGFVCSGFDHPSPDNMRLGVVDGELTCPVEQSLEDVISSKVGAISFTAPTFIGMVLNTSNTNFSWVQNDDAQNWLKTWFSM